MSARYRDTNDSCLANVFFLNLNIKPTSFLFPLSFYFFFISITNLQCNFSLELGHYCWNMREIILIKQRKVTRTHPCGTPPVFNKICVFLTLCTFMKFLRLKRWKPIKSRTENAASMSHIWVVNLFLFGLKYNINKIFHILRFTQHKFVIKFKQKT